MWIGIPNGSMETVIHKYTGYSKCVCQICTETVGLGPEELPERKATYKEILLYHNSGKAEELHEMEAHSLTYTKEIQE
jgi:hypothetical protein